ncbi:hypothetical protein [uncultured Clostridium sp.]|jgi:hypothetical protein|uniref:hypothetical protein n=1 Tax=uncultured Clostridium sp. TaxID=59620 RepID=UPI00206022ED|nr:hypothetical protein [uncultured Clostridium sp.]DAT91672.1 MAG TPA: hypothetical protein [Caudoviricetes sp.]DAZ35314.1 MAG TPA: hypothetical protein [Caudoviricetes sp.]
MSVISAEAFKNKATRIIKIDGFEPNEKIEVRIKPASMLGMIAVGKLPNNLLQTVDDLFISKGNKKSKGKVDTSDMNPDELKMVMEMIDTICRDCMVEPLFDDIKMFMTDAQKMQIMSESTGTVNAVIPFIQK